MKIVGIIFIVLAIIIFILSFWLIAPKTCNAIPDGQYKALFDIIVYWCVGLTIGVSMPLSLLIYGIFFIFFEDK